MVCRWLRCEPAVNSFDGSSVANRGGGVGGEAMSFDTLPARGVGRSGAGAEAAIGLFGGVSAVKLALA